MAKGPAVITGGLVLAATGQVAASDLVLQDDLIAAIAPRGSVTSAFARRIDAANRLIIPGLINAHTHGHGGLAKGIVTLTSIRPADAISGYVVQIIQSVEHRSPAAKC
jgi:cytosine/adenosine deaminase-related metal-dependent hydrolase